MTRSGAPRPSFLRSWLIWTAGFLAFPVAGLAGTAVAGRVDTPAAALLGGAVTGLVIGWSVTLCVIILRTRVLPRWLGVTGLAVSALYLFNQGDILATAVPGFPVWDLAGLLGSTGWGLWVAALGATLLLRPTASATPRASTIPRASTVDEINEVDGVGAVDTPFGSAPTATRPPTEAGLRNGTP